MDEFFEKPGEDEMGAADRLMLHTLFLNHMLLNGIEVVSRIGV